MSQVARQSEKNVMETANRGATATTPTWVVPRANIRETKDAYNLELEMPGVPKDGLEISVEGNELTIIGRRNTLQPKGDVVYRESRSIDFRRVFDLDPSIDTAKISARMDQGVVTLTLPKTESVKPRKIEVM